MAVEAAAKSLFANVDVSSVVSENVGALAVSDMAYWLGLYVIPSALAMLCTRSAQAVMIIVNICFIWSQI